MKSYQKLEEPNIKAVALAATGDILDTERTMREFMAAARQDVPAYPTLATREVQLLRVRLIQEELNELAQAYDDGSMVEVADAVTDLYYVILGTAVAHGLNQKALYEAVHDNNMSKILNGHVDEGGKFIKPADHLPPDLHAILEAQWRASAIRADGNAVTCTMCKVVNRVHRQDAAPFEIYNVLCDGVRVKL